MARDHLSDIINKVAYAGERYTLTRRGHEIAVMISVDEWKAISALLEQIEDREDIKAADSAYAQYLKEGGIPFEQAKKELGL